MSYIRCLSNPEGLYIWGQSDGAVVITHSVQPPLSSKWPRRRIYRAVGKGPKNRMVPTRKFYDATPAIKVPIRVFHHVCRKWTASFEDRVSYRGLTVEEVHVYLDTGKPVPNQTLLQSVWDMDRGRRDAFLIRLSYKGQFFHMWRVTWEYVTGQNADRWTPKPRRKRGR